MSFWIEDSNQRGRSQGVAFAAEFGCDAAMDQFISKHADAIEGTLSCFDRLIFRGYLPFFSGYVMAACLEAKQVHRWDLKRFVIEQAERLKTHDRVWPWRGLVRPSRGLRASTHGASGGLGHPAGEQGLVCIHSVVEPCRTFSLRWQERHYVQVAERKCLFLYVTYALLRSLRPNSLCLIISPASAPFLFRRARKPGNPGRR